MAKILLVLTTSFSGQNFLGQPWLPMLLSLVPEAYQRRAALRLLGLSPHYFIYQWTSKYSEEMSRLAVLEAEHRRNIRSRRTLYEEVLSTYVRPDMTVMDFGCGPGYLAGETARHVKKVLAVDISPGAIACAQVLNDHDNIVYRQTSEETIDVVDDGSVDLIYSFAVVQHMQDDAMKSIAEEWFRVLKPGGRLLCHVALRLDSLPSSGSSEADHQVGLDLRSRYALRMRYRTKDQVRVLLHRCGFEDVRFSTFKGLNALDDDVAREPIISCSKP